MQRVINTITSVLPIIGTGSFGYHDNLPWMEVAQKFEDPKGRKGFCLPVSVTSTVTRGGKETVGHAYGMIAVFQRYVDNDNLWVEVGSHEATYVDGMQFMTDDGYARILPDPVISDAEHLYKAEEIYLRILAGAQVRVDVKTYSQDVTKSRLVRQLLPEEVRILRDRLEANPQMARNGTLLMSLVTMSENEETFIAIDSAEFANSPRISGRA